MLSPVTDADYKARIAATQAGLLFCYKKMCPYCKNTEAALVKFARIMPGLSYLAVNIEDNPQTVSALSILRAPTVCKIRDGKIETCKTGVMSPGDIARFYSGI